jgi:hypothetical protein
MACSRAMRRIHLSDFIDISNPHPYSTSPAYSHREDAKDAKKSQPTEIQSRGRFLQSS